MSGRASRAPLQQLVAERDGSPDFYLYKEGDRRVTEWWIRLPSSFPLERAPGRC